MIPQGFPGPYQGTRENKHNLKFLTLCTNGLKYNNFWTTIKWSNLVPKILYYFGVFHKPQNLDSKLFRLVKLQNFKKKFLGSTVYKMGYFRENYYNLSLSQFSCAAF